MKYFFDTEFIEDGKTIELISIGIVADDGREYYAEVENIPWDTASDWVLVNVKPHLLGGEYVKSRSQIAEEIRKFISGNAPQFWAFCGAYDWVVLNWLYGPMIEHPSKWPYYHMELSQLSKDKGISKSAWPKQEGTEHNALEDAKWNKKLYEFLTESEIN